MGIDLPAANPLVIKDRTTSNIGANIKIDLAAVANIKRKPQRDFKNGIPALLKWFSNPASLNGTNSLFRWLLAFGEPTFHSMVETMRTHPDGIRLLRDKPDLGKTLNNMELMATMPEGSLGKCFYDFMNIPGVVPGYLLTGQMYRKKYFAENVEGKWHPETVWLTERLFNTHDITHAFAGYGSAPITGETINFVFSTSMFIKGRWADILNQLFVVVASLLPGRIPRKEWYAWLYEAKVRGQAVANHTPFPCIYWEEWLDKPLEDFRAYLGLPDMTKPFGNSDFHYGYAFYDWLSNGFGQNKADYIIVDKMRKICESPTGITPREMVTAPPDIRDKMFELYESGAPYEEIRKVSASRTHDI